MDLDTLARIGASPHAAGAAGAALSAVLVTDCGIRPRIIAVLCGICAWLFIAPALGRWIGLQSDVGPHLVYFLAALFGAKAMRRAHETFDAIDWKAVVGKFVPIKKDLPP